MALYCTKCGAKLNENVKFCEKCGAPVEKNAPEKSSGSATKKNGLIGIAVIAVAVLVVITFVIKGFGGTKNETSGEGGLGSPSDGVTESGNDVLDHLKPWMGEWGFNYYVYPEQGNGLLNDLEIDGYYAGGLMQWRNSGGNKNYVHVNEQYIDFSDITKDQKDCFPVSALTYYKTDSGADAFVDEDREMRIVFYDRYPIKDIENVMKIQLYVGEDTEVIKELYGMSFGEIHAAPDGWAADMRSFVKID